MKKLLIAAAVTSTLLVPLAAQAEKIGLAMAQQDTFLTILKNGTLEAGKKFGATVQVEDAGNDVGKQLSQIQNMIAQKVDAIIVNPVDTDATPKITKMVSDAKIPLVYVNRKPVDFAKLPAGVAFVASDEKVSGTVQTQQVCKLLNGKGNLLVLMGELSNEAARTRTQDIEDVVKTPECSGLKIVDKREGAWDRTKGQDIMTNWLSSGVKFDAIVANNDEMAIGAILAAKDLGLRVPQDVSVIGIDDHDLAEFFGITTITQTVGDQATFAVKTILDLLADPSLGSHVNVDENTVWPSELIVRSSTARVNS